MLVSYLELKGFIMKIQTAFKKIVQAQSDEVLKCQAILAHIEALSMFYHSAHWLTNGPEYYADHLLFERLYTETYAEIDSVGERCVNKFDPNDVLIENRIANIQSILESLNTQTEDQNYLVKGLALEKSLLNLLDEMEKASISSGTRNLFAGIADLHESHVYLITQRLQ